jgi:hypothetical protein
MSPRLCISTAVRCLSAVAASGADTSGKGIGHIVIRKGGARPVHFVPPRQRIQTPQLGIRA